MNAVSNTQKPLAFCLTEEQAGSDITSIQTTAIKKRYKFFINGKESYCY